MKRPNHAAVLENVWVAFLPDNLTLYELGHLYIYITLVRKNWNRTHAAKQLGISVKNIREKIKELEFYGYKVEENKKRTWL